MNKLGVLARVPGYMLFRALGWPKMLPINLTVGLTYRCNSRCKTCNVWRMKSENELSTEEFDEVFRKLGEAYWFTMSGGEPFLRDDLVKICQSAHDNCKPGIINIPTNGLLFNVIPKRVEEILEVCPKSKIIVNLSLDGVGEQHDEIRGVKGNFQRAMKTYSALRALDQENFDLGIHSVISVFNVHDFHNVYEKLKELGPDSYITEIAEERAELGTVGSKITPSLEDYSKAIDYLSQREKNMDLEGVSKVTKAFRLEYYRLVKTTLKERRQIIPCYAGFASAQIAPNGDVWTCCIRAEPVGNLRAVGYSFKQLWHGERADELRTSIKRGECNCPHANASYTNMLCSLKTLMKVGLRWMS
jgi:MoaA/NifB/PqqE/SkfB family radical SAM enzyme